ncbi:MAG: hypothetical protein LQ352_002604 [Teloschistes flavicans]|nr:MAG: hypothetical protein LQ352_002604 [Teloschistes flavicans]
MQTTRDRQEHDARRRIWAGAFNDTMIRSYEQRLIPYQDKLIIYLLDLDGKPVNVSHLLNLYSYDVMGDLAFGTSFNMLKSDQQHSAIQLLRAALTTLSWNLPMWLFRLLLAVPGATGGWQPFVSYCCERLDERMLNKTSSTDIMSFLLDPWADCKLSSSEMNMLRGDSQLVIVAGSDTTSSTLVCVLHELAKLPNGIPKLRSEIDSLLTAGKPISNHNLHSLTFLNGIINETLRLYPPTGMLQRITPPEGLDIGGTQIPGNTTVFCPFYALGRSGSSLCPSSAQWRGTYNCIGKPVAMMNLRTTLAKLILNFDIEVQDESQFEKGMRTGFTMYPGALWVSFTARERKKV